MSRCSSWRPVAVSGHVDHVPGDCRSCWVPCHHKVPEGAVRCNDCLLALATHRSEKVRLALLEEPDIGRDIVDLLLTDPHVSVASLARERLGEFPDEDDKDTPDMGDEGW